MARGILSGMIVGTLVAGVGAGGLSLLAGPPSARLSPNPMVKNETADPAGQQAPSEDAAAGTAMPTLQDAPVVADTPSVQTPTADGSVATDSTAPAPETAEVEGAPEAPSETAEPTIAASDDAPKSTPQAVPTVPAEDSEVAVATEPAKPEPQAPTEAAEPEPLPDALPDEEREEITLNVAPEQPQAEAEPAPKTESSTIGTPAKTLGSSQSSRLPTVQAEATQDADNTPEKPDSASASDIPFERFAQAFKGDATKPKMAIVLIDDGTSNIGFEALTTFPYPLSFAVDTSWKGAREAMDVYRAAGFEVLAMVDLPRGARASDVEVAMPVLLEAVPEAVGVMETPDAGLQESREVSGQVSEYLANSGHGLLLFPKGLNTAQKLAAKEGVPSVTVFRDFDIKGQNASAIKRFLNHAALKAGSEGGVVMVGRLRADTISALLLWGLQDRSDRLELAPISQLMKTQN